MPIGRACPQLAFTVSDVRRSQRTTRNTSIKSRDAQDPVPILVTGPVPHAAVLLAPIVQLAATASRAALRAVADAIGYGADP